MPAPFSQPYILQDHEGIKWDHTFKALGTMPQHTANTQQVLLLLAQLSQASLF